MFLQNTPVVEGQMRGTHGRDHDSHKSLVGKTKRKKQLDRIGVDGRIILKWTLKIWNEDVGWTRMVQDRVEWRALVSTAKFHIRQVIS
jgi:hypothetical protein